MGVFKWTGYGMAGLFGLSLVLGDEPGGPDTSVLSTPSAQVVVKADKITALPNDPEKEALFSETAQPVAFRSPTPVPEARAPAYVYVTGSRVNVRAGPGTSNARVGAFGRGTKLAVLETQAGWSRVRGSVSGTTTVGWMSQDYLSNRKPAPVAVSAPRRARAISAPSRPDISKANKVLISQSISVYPGNCPCPYNRDRAGRRCGKRSAWSKPGGRSPLCYDSDITRSHLSAYFKRIGQQYP
ncbi:SH3 domain-containing protein [Tateyamaria sp.]|uniref:SH3 domain-containing protein n=1 Tax=Tateyamaria sp. TaxID=1929288 RepID=UPI00329C3223